MTQPTPNGADHSSEDFIETAEVIDGMMDQEPVSNLELPEDPAVAIEMLQDALELSRLEASRYLDDYRRMAAEFDNYRKRTQRDQSDLAARAAERVVTNLLPVLDSFDAALAIEVDDGASEKLLDGMRGTREQVLAVLRNEGLEPIETFGVTFDPELHEAVQVSDGSGTMMVTAELRRGYRFQDRVMRAALVAVGYEEANDTQ